MHGRKKVIVSISVLLVLVTAILIVFPVSTGKLREKYGPNGLAEKRSITVDGAELGLILLSEDVSNPVLLVCGGGPGIPQYLLEELYPSVLPSKFTVCYWDYRGTGTSYSPDLDPSTMDTDRFVEDTVAVTDYLRDRFGCGKVYIMGHSFGTYVALQTVSRYPEKYCCYIAMSQVVDQRRSEIEAYDYMRQRYVELGDEKMVSRFDEYDIKNSHEDLISYCSSGLRDEAMHELGVGTTRDMDNVIEDLFFPSLRVTSYTQGERIDLWRGKALSKHFAEDTEVKDFNAMEDIPSIEVPIVFVVGRYDMTCCADLQQEYYEYIEAPCKKIYIFEESAHSPLYEESEMAAEVLDEIKEDITCI